MPVDRSKRRTLGLGLAVCLAAPALAQRDDQAFTGLSATRLGFAQVEEARRLLAADDEWMRAVNPLQQRLVMGRNEPVTAQAFRAWTADAALAWTEAQRARWQAALGVLAPRLNELRLPLPAQVSLVASNGQDSAGMAYTRGQFVVVPVANAASPAEDVFLMAHELWHVASRHDPALATRLYAEIGFEPMPLLGFPPAWADIRLVNPDAPGNRHAMRLAVDGRERLVTPVLVASRTVLQPGETFFNVVEVRLLEVRHEGKVSRAVLRDGQPVWHAVAAPHEYLRRLGGNTSYVIHPEETIADNVALLITQRPARNTQLLQRLRVVFEAQPAR